MQLALQQPWEPALRGMHPGLQHSSAWLSYGGCSSAPLSCPPDQSRQCPVSQHVAWLSDCCPESAGWLCQCCGGIVNSSGTLLPAAVWLEACACSVQRR